MIRNRGMWLLILLPVFIFSALSQQLTVQALFGSSRYAGRGLAGVKWMPDGTSFSYQQFDSASQSTNLYLYRVQDGRRDRLVDVSRLKLAPDDPPFRYTSYQWSPDGSHILFVSAPPAKQYLSRLTPAGNFFLYEVKSASFRRLTNVSVPQFNPKFSPDGMRLGFVRGNNLYVLDLSSGVETALTTDGEEHIINGKFDWVYEEEFGISDGWQWSPDGSAIAFWRLDERRVPTFNMMDFMTLRADVLPMRYPKAGDPNAIVKIGVVAPGMKKTLWMDLGANDDIYIPRMQWMPDGRSLAITRLNRLQNTIELLSGDVQTGVTHAFFSEQERTWIEEGYDLRWLPKRKQFLRLSERDGYNHVYLFDLQGHVVRQVTSGVWDVTAIAGVDERNGYVFVTACVKSPMERHLYRVALDKPEMKQLTADGSSHSPNMSPDAAYVLDTYSSTTAPGSLALIRSDGTPVRVVEENRIDALRSLKIGKQDFFTFTTSDSVSLNGWMITPPDFDRAKKYPVLMYVYGGPGSQTVTNSWGGSNGLWHHLLAQKGYLVVSVDGRGTGQRGKSFKNIVYRQLGRWEVHDQIEAAKYLGTLPFVDSSRIGIWGWSYGGYMAALTLLQGAGVFKAAVAVAPVTDWKFYDTIYSERYMGLPQENAEGYRDASPITHAGKLAGSLLLVHGTTDDNVHWQNSVQLIDALQKEGKQFETMFYANRNHGIGGGNTRVHLFEMITKFIEEKL